MIRGKLYQNSAQQRQCPHSYYLAHIEKKGKQLYFNQKRYSSSVNIEINFRSHIHLLTRPLVTATFTIHEVQCYWQ